MTEADMIRSELATLFRRVLNVADFDPTPEMTTGSHPHWDSIANVEILIGCEERWGFEFGATEIDAIRSFGDLCDAVAARIG